jgi:hypothetical protein
MLFLVLLVSLLAGSAFSARNAVRNPVVIAPTEGTFNAGDNVEIKWTDATTGFVNIQLVNESPDVLSSPFTIALGVPAVAGKYVWKVPSSLKSASRYRIIVWGIRPSDNLEKSALNGGFTIVNNIPNAVNTFRVLTPNANKQCAVGGPCTISWDYPDFSDSRPAYVHVRLFKGDNTVPSMYIAHVPADQKSYTWNVPNDQSLLGPDMYISVSAEGSPAAGPGIGDNMGGNGEKFKMDPSYSAASASLESSTELETETVAATSTVKKTITAKVKKQNNAAASSNSLPTAAVVFALIAGSLAFLL